MTTEHKQHAPTQTLPSGVLVINKPKGPTSAGCLAAVKRSLKIKKAGHAGTLDPMATGVLLLLLGQATKLSPYLMGRKIYSGCLELGRITDTWDAEGETLSTAPVDNITQLQVKQAVEDWLEITNQEVPAYSAAKHNGEPLYKLSRQGLPTPQKIKAIQIFKAEMLESNLPYVKFRVECSSGTYIRSLAHSLGMRFGIGATLTELTREYSHPFSLNQAITEQEALESPENAWGKLVSIEDALFDWNKITLEPEQEKDIRNGKQIVLETVAWGNPSSNKALLLDPNKQPLALAEITRQPNGIELKVLRGLWN